jgi:cell division protein FtsZ
MTINLKVPDIRELKPRITVFGVGGAGGNAVNNMIELGLQGCEFVVGNTDAQALTISKAHRVIQMGVQVTEGLGAGSRPEVGCAAAQEVIDEIRDHLAGAHMVFVTAGMGGGTGTGAAPVVAAAARDMGILTVGVVTKPFHFEGQRRMRLADTGITELQKAVDTLIVIPNQNLFRVANEQTTFADAFAMADKVLYSGVACITDLMVKEGLINLDFADVRAVMREMGKAMMGTGEAQGEKRAMRAAEAAIANPLLDDVCMRGARGLLISITGGPDLTLYEVDEAATRIREEVDEDANVIFGATRDDSLEGIVRVSVVATGIDQPDMVQHAIAASDSRMSSTADRLREEGRLRAEAAQARQAGPRPEIDTHAKSLLQAGAAPAPSQQAVMEPEPQPAIPQTQIHQDITVRALPPKQASYVEPLADLNRAPPEPAPQPEAFVPPRAAEPTMRQPRMPRIEELPVQTQREIASRQGAAASAAPVEKKRITLMERLAAAGFGRAKDEVPAQAPQQRQATPAQNQPTGPLPAAVHQEYAKRPLPRAPQGSVDIHGRPTSQARAMDDDQLEIPAFLRRQSN